jgi:methionyl-tRNA formyltransferase
LLVSIGWPYILPPEIVSKWSGRAFNLHPAILPDFPGYSPEWEVIVNEQPEHGLTLQMLSKYTDQGEIVAQQRFPVKLTDNALSLMRATFDRIPKFLVENLIKIRKGAWYPESQNPDLIKKYCPPRKPADSEFDPNESFIDLFHRIRACHPVKFPACFKYKGKKIYVRLDFGSLK